MIEMFNERSIAKGEAWFKADAFEMSGAETSWEKNRLMNVRDSIVEWARGNYSKTICISFTEKEELSLARFLEVFESTYAITYNLLWRYSTVEKCEDLVEAYRQNGMVIRRERSFNLNGDKKKYFHIAICEDNEMTYFTRDPKSKPSHLCDCGCGEYKPKMLKTPCCGRRYVNVVHQRSIFDIKRKCPCKC
jgi:hypothetical protein